MSNFLYNINVLFAYIQLMLLFCPALYQLRRAKCPTEATAEAETEMETEQRQWEDGPGGRVCT